jgi:flagellar hook protein FlgE
VSDLGSDIAEVIADARRAVIPGAIGLAPDRTGALVTEPTAMSVEYVPSASPLSVAIVGPGLFVLDRGGVRVYSRLGKFHVDERGRLTDAAGRLVLGFAGDRRRVRTGDLLVLSVDPRDVESHRYASYRIDANGVWTGEVRGVDPKRHRREAESVPLGRLALAIFPAPERLALGPDDALQTTPSAGTPVFVQPGAANTAILRPHALAGASVDLQGDLARLWMLRRRAELAAAMVGASDQCQKTALGLVK